MVYTGRPSRGCATCRKRRIKCDEKTPECGNCQRIKQSCPGYVNQFDLAWRDQTTVAKKGVERGKQKRKAAREQEVILASSSSSSSGGTLLLPSSSSQDGIQKSLDPVSLVKISGSTSRTQASDHSVISISSGAPTSDPRIHEFNSTGASIYRRLEIPPDDQVLTFFFNLYILPIRDPLARRGFLEYLAPIYSNTDPQSPFMLSTMAVASCMLSIRMGQAPNTTFSRAYYLRAVKALRDHVTEQKACREDEMLIAVLLLQMYELSVGQVSQKDISHYAHLNGALALVKHRGAANFTSPLSLAVMLYVRSLLIEEALQNNTRVPDEVLQWSEVFDDSAQLPIVRLDSINLDLANLRSSTSHMVRWPEPDQYIRAAQTQHVLSAALGIERRLNAWRDSIPESWTPTRICGDQNIPPSVQKAGLYQQHCDVYRILFLVLIWNKYRQSRIEVTRIILFCLNENPRSDNLLQRESYQNIIQQLVDDVCASIPFLLGDRTQPGNPGDPKVKYPQVPGRPPTRDHYQIALTMGGWSIMGPIVSLLKQDIKMRDGQRKWLADQMVRTARIYRISKIMGQRSLAT